MKVTRTCLNCGKTISVKYNKKCTKSFCNNKCYKEYKQKLRPVRKCEWCGKEFNPPSIKNDHFFCCTECYLSWKKSKKKVLICPVCKKEFTPAYYYPNKVQYCSQKCYQKQRVENNRKENTLTCTYCGKEYYQRGGKRKGLANNFCCRECYNKWKIEENLKNPPKKNCIICGKEIIGRWLANSYHWYVPDTCSPECRLKLSEQTCMKNYGVPNASQSDEIKKKKLDTMKKNGTTIFGTCEGGRNRPCLDGTKVRSNAEVEIYNCFLSAGIIVEYEHVDDRYPYLCDFYLPTYDIFIEYQGFMSHGKSGDIILGPYNEKREDHRQLLEEWKSHEDDPFFKSCIEVWTITDPEKRICAEKNNLNWYEFWTLEEFYIWFDSFLEQVC